MTHSFTCSNGTLIGFLDGDGSYQLRLIRRKFNKLGVSLCVEFTQQTDNEDVLDIIKKMLGSDVKIRRVRKKNSKDCKSVFAVSLDTEPGQRLLNMLKNEKPWNPGKRRDYLIALKCLEYSTTRTLQEVKTLQLNSAQLEEQVASIAVCVLIYGMTNEAHNQGRSGKKKQTTLQTWVDYLQAPKHLNDLGLQIGEQILQNIEAEVDSLKGYLCSSEAQLPEDYIVGYFIADGGLGVNLNVEGVGPYWDITEIKHSVEVLKAVQTTVGNYGSINASSENAAKLRVVGLDNVTDTIVPILDKYSLPKARQQQFNTFKRVLLVFEQNPRLTYEAYNQILDLAWGLNKEGSSRKKGKADFLADWVKKFGPRLIYCCKI